MCGILGIVAEPGGIIAVERGQVEFMRDAMQSRGPDGRGIYLRDDAAFAHRRLAIRDLQSGHQPWLSADERFALVYNGEIYNDFELRRELAAHEFTFHTRCDTEVLLAACRHWGSHCVDHLRGMFAFGFYDFEARSLLLARDRFGIKPLYFAYVDRSLVFASSPSAILRHPRFSCRPNMAAVSHYLTTFRLTLGRETMYEGIWQLLPGERLRFQHGELSIEQYWNYPDAIATEDPDETCDFADAAEMLRDTLAESIRLRLTSDVPVGMFVSGGVDSNTLACLLREQTSRPLVAKCAGGDDSPDFEYARQCASHVGFDFGEVRVSAENYFDCWQWMLAENALPLATPTDVLLHQLARDMKNSVGVVLGGEGADELVCGYAVQHWSGHDFDRARAIESGTWQGTPAAAQQFRESLQRQYGRHRFLSHVDHYFCLNSLIPVSAKPLLLQPQWWKAAEEDSRMFNRYTRLFDDCGNVSTPQRYAKLLHRVNLESLLSRLDSATMLAGLEARVPYADHVLVERMFRLPLSHKIAVASQETHGHLAAGELEQRGTLQSKRILRHVAQTLMPAPLALRKKASFPTPVASWLSGPWRNWASQTLLQSPFAREVFRREAMHEVAGNISQVGMWLWPLLNVVCWGDRQFAA